MRSCILQSICLYKYTVYTLVLIVFLNFTRSPRFLGSLKKPPFIPFPICHFREPHESPPTVWQNRGARRPAPGSMGPIQKAWKTNMAMGKSTHFSIGNIYLQMVDVSLILHCHFWCFRVYDSLYMNAFIHSYTAQVPGNAGLQPTLGTKGDQNRNQTSRRSLYQEFPTCYMLGSIGMHLHDFHHFKSVYILDGIQSHLEPQPNTLI